MILSSSSLFLNSLSTVYCDFNIYSTIVAATTIYLDHICEACAIYIINIYKTRYKYKFQQNPHISFTYISIVLYKHCVKRVLFRYFLYYYIYKIHILLLLFSFRSVESSYLLFVPNLLVFLFVPKLRLNLIKQPIKQSNNQSKHHRFLLLELHAFGSSLSPGFRDHVPVAGLVSTYMCLCILLLL